MIDDLADIKSRKLDSGEKLDKIQPLQASLEVGGANRLRLCMLMHNERKYLVVQPVLPMCSQIF